MTQALGCADGLVSRWCSGQRLPDARQAGYIEKTYGIPAVWWDEWEAAASGQLPAASDDSGPSGAVVLEDADGVDGDGRKAASNG